MRYLNRMVFVAAVFAVSAGTSFGQSGSIISGGGQSLGSLSGTGGLAGGIGSGQLGGSSGGLGGSSGSGGLGGGQGGQGGQLSGTSLMTMEQSPQITAPGTSTGGGSGGVLDSSNAFSSFYANPYYQGTWANSKSQAGPGGFGTPLAGTTTAAGNSRGGGTRLGGTGTTGRGGIGGMNTGSNQSGVVISTPVQIAYPAIPRFASTPITAPQIQADLVGTLSRSGGAIGNPAGVQVITQGNNVILRGTVRDEDEARLVEGMARMAPGVREVKNELTFPASGFQR